MDREEREERVRDSRIADIPALDDTIADESLESIEEADEFHDADDPEMAEDDPPTAGAARGAGGAGGGNRGAVGGQAVPAQAAAAAKPIVTPPQLQSLTAFDGKMGEGFVNWIRTLETARVTYRWPLNALVQVAKAKGGSAVVEWDRTVVWQA